MRVWPDLNVGACGKIDLLLQPVVLISIQDPLENRGGVILPSTP